MKGLLDGSVAVPGLTLRPLDRWTMVGHLVALGDPEASRLFDQEKAKAMLAAAGVKTPLDVDLWYMPVSRPYNPNGKRIGEMMQADLAKIGVNAKLVTYEWGEYRKRAQNGEDVTAQLGWTGDNGDPDNFFYPLLDQDSARKDGNAQNYSFWRDPAFHKLMLAGQATVDDAKRKPIYQHANAMVHDQAPAISLVHTTVPLAMKSAIHGFVASPNTSYHFNLVTAPAGH